MAEQKYKVTERIDAGGMAEVFRGVAESLHGFKKAVAIKRILPNLTRKPKFVAMFLDEAKLSLHLQHANIVQVFDIGVADNTYFIVMEYIDGGNLRTLLDSLRRQGRRMKIEHTIFIMMEVCKGLGYAHDMHDPESGRPLGIVHRDISPPNILISRQGEIKLVDFGLAKAASQVENTEPGVVKGKFSYLSPEAAEGKEVDHRSDIFAVGIVLFELLAGRRLFYGDTDYDTVQLVRQARIPSLKSLNTEVETQLEEIVRKALARDVVDRYQHAADLMDALAQYLFSRGMKVTNRDIALLVQQCLKEKERSAPPKPKVSSIIDALISEEIVKFTSLGDSDIDLEAPVGSRPLRPDEISDSHEPAGDTIDPRSWLDDFGGETPPVVSTPLRPPVVAKRQTGGQQVVPPPGARSGQTFRQFGALSDEDQPPAQPPAPPARPAQPPAPARTGKTKAQVAPVREPEPPRRSPTAPREVVAQRKSPSGQREAVAVPPEAAGPRKTPSAPRVATPIGGGGKPGGADLLQQMAGLREDGKPVPSRTDRPAPDRTPPPRRRTWLLVVAIVAVLALLGVAVTLAYQVGFIGGGGAPPAKKTRALGASPARRRRRRPRAPA